LKYIHIFI